jgi:hypothetical protein
MSSYSSQPPEDRQSRQEIENDQLIKQMSLDSYKFEEERNSLVEKINSYKNHTKQQEDTIQRLNLTISREIQKNYEANHMIVKFGDEINSYKKQTEAQEKLIEQLKSVLLKEQKNLFKIDQHLQNVELKLSDEVEKSTLLEQQVLELKNGIEQLLGHIKTKGDLRVGYFMDTNGEKYTDFVFEKIRGEFPYIRFMKNPDEDLPIILFFGSNSTARIKGFIKNKQLYDDFAKLKADHKIMIVSRGLPLNTVSTTLDKDLQEDGITLVLNFTVFQCKWTHEQNKHHNEKELNNLHDYFPKKPKWFK